VRLKELEELDVTGIRISPPEEAASEAGTDIPEQGGDVFDFLKLRKLTMGYGRYLDRPKIQSVDVQQVEWEQFPLPRTLEILQLDCNITIETDALAEILMKAVFPRLATSCPALREMYIRSWEDAQDREVYVELHGCNVEEEVAIWLCQEYPLLKKIRLKFSRRTEDGDWEKDGAPLKLVRF
jgi:hypothetical protein